MNGPAGIDEALDDLQSPCGGVHAYTRDRSKPAAEQWTCRIPGCGHLAPQQPGTGSTASGGLGWPT